ncbi:MAG TPA: transglutaminase-like domain-containing protein [Acidimicrobiia bacterium]|nr:transglutaminase-like domain-containing protein [Acidimicrobiia bacterium]
MTDAAERFTALVHEPEDRIELDQGALLIAACAHPDVDIARRLGELDALASDVRTAEAVGVAEALFGSGGFAGNTVDYYDPANSYLDDVLDRRLGIPITLSVLMIEVGRRVGVDLVGVGMPGHFLVGAPERRSDSEATLDLWFDPFHGPEPLAIGDCASLFARVHAGSAYSHPLRREQLAAVGPRVILDRMLANLQQTLLQRSPAAAAWPTRLRLSFPDVPRARRAELATTLGNLAQFAEAANVFDELARELPPDAAARASRTAAQLRARAN